MRFLKWWLLLLPWVFVPGVAEPFLLPRQMLYEVGGWLLVVSLLTQAAPRQVFQNRWLGWGLAWVVFNLGWQFWSALLLTKPNPDIILFHYYTILPSFDILMGGLLIVTLSTTVLTLTRHRIQLSKWVCWSTTAVAGYVLLQYLGFDQFFPQTGDMVLLGKERSTHMLGTMGNVSYVATYLGLTAPLFLIFKEKRYLVYLGLVLMALWVMGKSYGLLGAGSGLLAYAMLRLLHQRRWVRLACLLLLSLTVGLSLGGLLAPRVLANPRWLIWQEMARQMHQVSWTGYGLGSFATTFFVNWETMRHLVPPALQGSRWLWAHNDLLQCWYELGLLGVGLTGLAVWSTLRRVWQRTTEVITSSWLACAVSLLVVSCMNFPWHFAPSAALGILIWAMNEGNGTEGALTT